MTWIGGVDIGGTKCAVTIGKALADTVDVVAKFKFPTPGTPQEALRAIMDAMAGLLAEHPQVSLQAIGISCGGPLDSRSGLVLSPPNLPGWDGIDVVSPLLERFAVPVGLQNDANACALAEWKWGAGRGTRNMIFLTFGTGMGAGLILDGRLYAGTNDMAGEVGHMRMENDGPVGYGKAGSFEGYCSGGGIAQLGKQQAREALLRGEALSFCESEEALDSLTTQRIGEAASGGDPLALEIFRVVGEKLGRGLAILVDVLNPERIVIGSIYGRQQAILEPIVMKTLSEEALPYSLRACSIVPAGLGEAVGDLASLSVAYNLVEPA
ncbi:ROK family protein [Paenibacillus rhizovicinus]|uniref:ROK family protein n=1 Tax=Paenibacillus rhizovicinus TaxID=2704463 RepID=A0A6C0P541_9BACL|nr:ROK family protein [Paenibacillus rhizovicinus]QHW33664.1 ROK family protein [Paenibacillus rhizovicinus]